ncbi:MAG: hypothetical protein QOD77_181 [Thermoplasmata archaeon]|nr:hypothetical protein [Thermoplasmata archaeon]
MARPKQYEVLHVFIGSPNDVPEERKQFTRVIEEVNGLKAHPIGLHLEGIGWEDTLPGHGTRAQDLINKDVRECDLCVLVFWKRWGTPTDKFSSGTEEEFHVAKEAGKHILVYFRSVPDDQLADAGPQLQKVLVFKARLEKEQKTLYARYQGEEDWSGELRKRLCNWLDKRADGELAAPPTNDIAPVAHPSKDLVVHDPAKLEGNRQFQAAKVLEAKAREHLAKHEFTLAEEAYAKAVATFPAPSFLQEYGAFLRRIGLSGKAAAQYQQLLTIAEGLGEPETVWIAHEELGGLLASQGDSMAALASYREAFSVAETAVAKARGNGWLRRLSVSHNKIGGIHQAQGNLPAALTAYQDNLAIAQRLAAKDPANTQWQRDLSVSHDNIGGIHQAQGNLLAALTAYQDSLAIAQRLAAKDPANTQWQRDLSISHEKIGDILQAQGNLLAALTAYQDSLALRQTLAAKDPANTDSQRDLSVSHEKIGGIHQAQGNLPAALTAYQGSLALRQTLAAKDPANTEWQRDLSISHNKIGDILQAQGNLPAALTAYQDSLAIAQRLAAKDQANAQWQTDLVVSKMRFVMLAEGGKAGIDRERTRTLLEENLQTLRSLAAEKRLHGPQADWIADIEGRLENLNSAPPKKPSRRRPSSR